MGSPTIQKGIESHPKPSPYPNVQRTYNQSMLNKTHPPHPTPFEVFYDGACILCRKEMDMLKRWDRDQLIVFTDIADPDFANDNDTTKSYDELMSEIHGRVLGEPIIKGISSALRTLRLESYRFALPFLGHPTFTRFGLHHLCQKPLTAYRKMQRRCLPDQMIPLINWPCLSPYQYDPEPTHQMINYTPSLLITESCAFCLSMLILLK